MKWFPIFFLLMALSAWGETYRKVERVMSLRCISCHGEHRKDGGIDLSNYQGVRKIVVPGDPMGSRLYRVISLKIMPPHEYKVTPSEMADIANWVAAGARP